MPSNYSGRGGKGGHQKSFSKNGKHEKSEGNSAWSKSVQENQDVMDLDFADYDGEKKYELPEDFVNLLNAEKTEAKDDTILLESAFGITEYVTPDTSGFSGILKYRYSDFAVHEIDQDGKEIKLTDESLPSKPKSEAVVIPDKFIEYSQLDEEDKKLVSALSWVRILQLAKKSAETASKEGSVTEHGEVRIDVTKKSIDERKLIHLIIKRHFIHLETSGITEGDKKFVLVSAKKKISKGTQDKVDAEYLTFYLCKENVDTINVVGQLAREFGINHGKFNFNVYFAGNKIQRSLTTQKMSIKHELVNPKKLVRAVKSIRNKKIENKNFCPKFSVGNFKYEKVKPNLEDFKGNKFKIVLRNVKQSQETVAKAMLTLKENGFINYFGEQRFGQGI